jgi:hypothetical protein
MKSNTSLKMWTGWTGAMYDETSLKWWGFEQEYMGKDLVVQPGYQTVIDWSLDEIAKAGGEVKFDEKIVKITLREEGECLF